MQEEEPPTTPQDGLRYQHTQLMQSASRGSQCLQAGTAASGRALLNRVQDGRGYLEVEIRQLLHEVSRVAGGSCNARGVGEEGASAVHAALQELGSVGVRGRVGARVTASSRIWSIHNIVLDEPVMGPP
jgi:hypothetical protein